MKKFLVASVIILALAAGNANGAWPEIAQAWHEIQNGAIPYTNPATNTLDIRPGSFYATNVTATGLATPGAITVTPTLTQVGTINVVAGASLADGDYFTVDYGSGTIPIEFEATPPNGTTGGHIPFTFAAGDSAGTIRDGLIALISLAAPTKVVASIGGAAAITVTMVAPGVAGGVITENVTDAGFTVAGFADPTHATTVTYKLVARLPDGTTTEAGAASSTAASVATLSAANFNRLSWSAVTGASSYAVYRTVAPTSPATAGIVYAGTGLSVSDTGLAGGGEVAPTVNGTGVVTAGRVVASGLTYTQEYDASAGAGAVDWRISGKQKVVLGSSPISLSFTAPAGPCNLSLRLVQDGAGNRIITADAAGWASIKWPNGGLPLLSAGANAIDILNIYFDGTSYYGQLVKNFQ